MTFLNVNSGLIRLDSEFFFFFENLVLMDPEPQYRVLNPHPTPKDILKNINAVDALQLVGITVGCAVIGYACGISNL